MNDYSILLGSDEKNPLIEISSKEHKENVNYAKLPNLDSLQNFASVAFQAAPSLLTQAKVASSSIMEVVVNGNLVKAADGNGYRAFVRGADGKIIENAKLHKPESLSNLVNTAAVWQIASVVVAQKHLADISQKLDELKDGIDKIQEFQQTERKSTIYMISNKLKEKLTVIMSLNGYDKEGVVRAEEINSYDDTLEKIYLHLKSDLQTYGLKKIEHKEMFGSADYQKEMKAKITEINELTQLAYLCLNLRISGSSVLEYIGGKNQLIEYRLIELEKEISKLHQLIEDIKISIFNEIYSIKSKVNDFDSLIKNNKKTYILGGIPAVALKKTGQNLGLIEEDYDKVDILEERKKELRYAIGRCVASSMQNSQIAKQILQNSLNKAIASSEPIKLAFQRIDDDYVLCLNNNEKILVPA